MADLSSGSDLSGGGGGGTRTVDVFTATASQTVFSLSALPLSTDDVMCSVNGVEYVPGTDFSVSGSTLTWLDGPFAMDAGDVVLVDYDS